MSSFDRRPESTEHAPYYSTYVGKVPDGDIIATLEREIVTTRELLAGVPDDVARRAYEKGKWTLKEVMAHVIDAERAFSYRGFWFARGCKDKLPSMEQDEVAREARAQERPLEDLVEELTALRRSNVLLFGCLDDKVLSRRGIASGVEFTVRAIPWILAGHEIHHRGVIAERYLG